MSTTAILSRVNGITTEAPSGNRRRALLVIRVKQFQGLVAFVVLIGAAGGTASAEEIVLHVSPAGDDAWQGSEVSRRGLAKNRLVQFGISQEPL